MEAGAVRTGPGVGWRGGSKSKFRFDHLDASTPQQFAHRMQIVDPISGEVSAVSVFVASLPYSGLVFAYGCLDEVPCLG